MGWGGVVVKLFVSLRYQSITRCYADTFTFTCHYFTASFFFSLIVVVTVFVTSFAGLRMSREDGRLAV